MYFHWFGLLRIWFCVVVSVLNSYHLVSSFPPAAVADMPGEGDEVVVGVVARTHLLNRERVRC